MRDNYCFLCTSDEGVFLDVYEDSKFFDKIETCLTTKLLDKDSISSNICYKCAFEVDQCSEFVKKYKSSHRVAGRKKKSNNNCCLCLESGVEGKIFDLVKEKHSINDPFLKIQEIFQNDFSKSPSVLICLNCRYCLDVLYDLKTVYKAMSTKDRNSIIRGDSKPQIPKTKTHVISRKTTKNHHKSKIGLPTISDTDSDSSIAMSQKECTSLLTKSTRQCEKCQSLIANGVDMYRFHRTGLTVCKGCWVKEDPGKTYERKRVHNKNTRRCAVFLKDVFDNETDLYKVEKDEFGNTTYIVTDEGSESEEKPIKNTRSKKTGRVELNQNISKLKEESKKSQTEESSNDEATITKKGRQGKAKTPVSSSDNDDKHKRASKRKNTNENISGDSKIEVSTPKRTRMSSTSSVGSASSVQFKSPKDNKDIIESKLRRGRSINRSVPVIEEMHLLHSNNVKNQRGKKRVRINASEDEKIKDEELEEEKVVSEGSKEAKKIKIADNQDDSKVNKENSIAKIDESTKEKTILDLEKDENEVKPEETSENNIYSCKQCDLTFSSKSNEIDHALTHSKNMSLKLHRVKSEKSPSTSENEADNGTSDTETIPLDKNQLNIEVIKKNVNDENDDVDIEGIEGVNTESSENLQLETIEKNDHSDKEFSAGTVENEKQQIENVNTSINSELDKSNENDKKGNESPNNSNNVVDDKVEEKSKHADESEALDLNNIIEQEKTIVKENVEAIEDKTGEPEKTTEVELNKEGTNDISKKENENKGDVKENDDIKEDVRSTDEITDSLEDLLNRNELHVIDELHETSNDRTEENEENCSVELQISQETSDASMLLNQDSEAQENTTNGTNTKAEEKNENKSAPNGCPVPNEKPDKSYADDELETTEKSNADMPLLDSLVDDDGIVN